MYLWGRKIPLYGIDTKAYINQAMGAEELLLQTIGGDTYRCSLFALGISPYMTAAILVQVYTAIRQAGSGSKISPFRTNRLIVLWTTGLAILQAVLRVKELYFQVAGGDLLLARGIAVLEMVTGVLVILWLSERNKKYGIGGQTALIFVNILDGIIASVGKHSLGELILPLVISCGMILVIVEMENTEFRIPLQRISIHNIYADKNYLAIKMNPIGTMPVMFSTAFFMIPQVIVYGLSLLFPKNGTILWWREGLNLKNPLGIGIYILIIYVLTMLFAMLFINPRELTEQFLKSGDCLLNIRAGKETKRYLSRKIFWISFASATVMSLCLGIPLYLQYKGNLEGTLVMLPSSVMLLAGMWCNLYRECLAVKSLDSYEEFI